MNTGPEGVARPADPDARAARLRHHWAVLSTPCSCHWFSVNGKTTTRYVSHGAVTIQNMDENTLKFVRPAGTKLDKVGKTVTLSAKGSYHITMIGQAKDDNHLLLIVK